jgi:hypothetical protein
MFTIHCLCVLLVGGGVKRQPRLIIRKYRVILNYCRSFRLQATEPPSIIQNRPVCRNEKEYGRKQGEITKAHILVTIVKNSS